MKIELSERDRICFLGDSITANGLFIAEIWDYFVKRYPEKKVELYNCGIAGSKGMDATEHDRLYCDFFNYFPKYGIIMFGMNDVNRYFYDENHTPEETEANLRQGVEKYEQTMENIVALCRERGVTPILCSPTPYDAYNDYTAKGPTPDTELERYHDIVEKIAEKYGLLFVDMRKALMDKMDERPIWEDRIHPAALGNHYMAQAFIKAIEGDGYVPSEEAFTLSGANQKRFATEQTLRNHMFVERVYSGWQKLDKFPTVAERKAEVSELVKKETGWLEEVYTEYLRHVDELEELKGQLLKETFAMYR